MPNLLEIDATVYYQTKANPNYNKAENLITNFSSRSARDKKKARLDIERKEAEYFSCYATKHT